MIFNVFGGGVDFALLRKERRAVRILARQLHVFVYDFGALEGVYFTIFISHKPCESCRRSSGV